MVESQAKGIRAEIGITRLYVPHSGGEICFAHPAKGKGAYANVAGELKQSFLQQPTASQNSSLIHAAWQNPKEQYSQEIIQISKNNWLWCYNGILYVPNEGAYIQDRPEIKENKIIMDKSELVKRLESNDTSVRFVPFGYKINEQTPQELAKNEFVRKLAGDEGAEKLAETASKYKYNPNLFSFDNVNEQLIRVSALGDVGDFGRGLFVLGGFSDDDRCYAFGVVGGEADDAQKISERSKINNLGNERLEKIYQELGEILGKH